MRSGTRLLIAAAALVITGCASGGSTSMAPPTVDVTGKWSGTWSFENASVGGGQVIMDLKQTGSDVSGSMTVSGPTVSKPSSFEGTVSGNTVTPKSAYASGSLTVNGDEMKGYINGIMPATVTVRRQK